MKTTNKYAAKVSQPESVSARDTQISEPTPAPSHRDIVLMRIRHILKSAREVS